jgi:DNA recombination protein RmuC
VGLGTARDSYDEAMKKLTTGRGNAIRQAELLKDLGVKPSKQMPKELVGVLQEELALTLVEESEE